MIFTQVNLQQKYAKALPARQGTRPTRFDKFHGLSLKLIINYVTIDIVLNTPPLIDPLIPPRAHGCLAVIVVVPLLIPLIFDAVVYVPLFVVVPLLPIVITVPFPVAELFLYLLMGLYYCIYLYVLFSVMIIRFLLQ